MKILLTILYFIGTISSFGQTNQINPKGTYFKMKPGEYFERVIKPWKYQYTPAPMSQTPDSVQKVGQIIFWRSEPVYDNASKKYWTPNITYNIYVDSASSYTIDLTIKIKSLYNCDSLNSGDILLVGHFLLISAPGCVNCTSTSNIGYCRNVIKSVFESVLDKDTYNWKKILRQLIIDNAKFKI